MVGVNLGSSSALFGRLRRCWLAGAGTSAGDMEKVRGMVNYRCAGLCGCDEMDFDNLVIFIYLYILL